MAGKPRVKATTINEYLAGVSAEHRAALEALRRAIQRIVPKAEECISYGLPAFRLNGRPLVAFGATAGHCAFFPMSGFTVEAHRMELRDYDTSKGTIRFQPDKPLPAALLRKLVKARIAENERSDKNKPVRGKQRVASTRAGDGQTDPAVVEFLRVLDHPLKKDIEAVRRIILGVSPAIREGIKWNSVSFRTSEFFATVFLRATDRVQLIFHRGAKAKDNTKALQIADPAGLLKWLATDRCMVTLGAGKEIRANRAALEAIVREWIGQM